MLTLTEGNTMLSRYHYQAVILLLRIAAFSAFTHVINILYSFNEDELSNFYDGYSFVETEQYQAAESYYSVVRRFGNWDYGPSLLS